MNKVFVDTNVLIDFYQRREPFFKDAATLFQLAYDREIELVVSATTVINAFYLLRKTYQREELYDRMKSLFLQVTVSDITSEMIAEALAESWHDFEDCVQYKSSSSLDVDVVLTRNVKDFQQGIIPVMTPSDFLRGLSIM